MRLVKILIELYILSYHAIMRISKKYTGLYLKKHKLVAYLKYRTKKKNYYEFYLKISKTLPFTIFENFKNKKIAKHCCN